MDFGRQAYETSLMAGNKIAEAYEERQQKSKIEEILQMAHNTNDPNVINDSIGQILMQVKDPNQRQAVAGHLTNLSNRMRQQKQSEAIQQEGINPNLPLDLQKIKFTENEKRRNLANASQLLNNKSLGDLTDDELNFVGIVPELKDQYKNEVSRRESAMKFYREAEQKMAPMKAALEVSNQLEKVLEEKYWSYGPMMGNINRFGSASGARQEIVTLGNSLLQMAFNFPIRNQKEFEAAKESLTNPYSLYSENIAAVKSLQKMIRANIESVQQSNTTQSGASKSSPDSKEVEKQVIDQQTVNEMF